MRKTNVKILREKDWKQLEEVYYKIVKTLFAPPKWGVGIIISESEAQRIMTEIEDLELNQPNMQYIGTSYNNKEKTSWCEYYLDNNKLVGFIYEEILEYTFYESEEDIDCDAIHTGQFHCVAVAVTESAAWPQPCHKQPVPGIQPESSAVTV